MNTMFIASAKTERSIRHVMTGLNPQGVGVASFKVPEGAEKRHDYLWRVHNAVPGWKPGPASSTKSPGPSRRMTGPIAASTEPADSGIAMPFTFAVRSALQPRFSL